MQTNPILKSKAINTASDIDERVAISIALQRYLRAVERFEAISAEFNDACQGVRRAIPPQKRFVAIIAHQVYLVTSDRDGNFEVEQIDLI